MSLGNKKVNDHSGLSMNVIKNAVLNIAEPITFICNISLSHGYFPEIMKIAKIMPIHKTEDKHIFTNYGPNLLLAQFSKIFSKIY